MILIHFYVLPKFLISSFIQLVSKSLIHHSLLIKIPDNIKFIDELGMSFRSLG